MLSSRWRSGCWVLDIEIAIGLCRVQSISSLEILVLEVMNPLLKCEIIEILRRVFLARWSLVSVLFL